MTKTALIELPQLSKSKAIKFVIARVAGNYVLRADDTPDISHTQIIGDIVSRHGTTDLLTQVSLISRGGGYLELGARRQLRVYGKSVEFGAAVPKLVTQLLHEYACSRNLRLAVNITLADVRALTRDLWLAESPP